MVTTAMVSRLSLASVGLVIFWSGIFGQVIYLGLIFSAIDSGVPSGTTALIASLQPLVIATIAGPLLGERTSTGQRIGLALGLVGVSLVVAHDLGGDAPLWAYGVVIVGMLSLVTATVLTRRQRDTIHLLASITVQSIISAVGFAILAAFTGQLTPSGDADFWIAVGWLVVLSTFGGYGCFQYVIRQGGATLASTLLYLTPPTTMIWAWLMFGDGVGVLSIVGLAVCALGVVLATRRTTQARAVAKNIGNGRS